MPSTFDLNWSVLKSALPVRTRSAQSSPTSASRRCSTRVRRTPRYSPPPSLLSAVDYSQLTRSTNDDLNSLDAQTSDLGGGNRDGLASANPEHAASLRASSNGALVSVEALGGLTLSNIRAIKAPTATTKNVSLPLGMFGFDVHGVMPGGAATV